MELLPPEIILIILHMLNWGSASALTATCWAYYALRRHFFYSSPLRALCAPPGATNSVIDLEMPFMGDGNFPHLEILHLYGVPTSIKRFDSNTLSTGIWPPSDPWKDKKFTSATILMPRLRSLRLSRCSINYIRLPHTVRELICDESLQRIHLHGDGGITHLSIRDVLDVFFTGDWSALETVSCSINSAVTLLKHLKSSSSLKKLTLNQNWTTYGDNAALMDLLTNYPGVEVVLEDNARLTTPDEIINMAHNIANSRSDRDFDALAAFYEAEAISDEE